MSNETTETPERSDVDGLLSQLFAKLGKRSAAADDEGDGGGRDGSRDGRIQELSRERRALLAEREALRADLAKVGEARVAELKALKEGFANELARFAQGKDHELQLMERGLSDSDGRTLALKAWESASATTRGKTPADHWGQLVSARDAHLADPEKVQAPAVSKALAAYFPAPATGDKSAAGAQGKPAPRQPPRSLDAGTRSGPRTVDDIPSGLSPEQFMAQLNNLA